MSNPSTHEAYQEKQNGIYAGIEARGEALGVEAGLVSDVTEAQGAYLVAWRHPEGITSQVEEISHAVGSLASALTYDRASLHTTLSDLGLAPGLVIDPRNNRDHEDILDMLANSVKAGLDTAGHRAIADRQIAFNRYITNGRAVIAPGQASNEILDINASVKAASAQLGVNGGDGLKGSWGAHMTVNRFTTESDLGTAANVVDSLRNAPEIGLSVPTAIDVGYLAVSRNGFTFTTHERFPLNRE